MDQPRPRPAEWISGGLVDESTEGLLRELLHRSAQAAGASNTALWLVAENTLAPVLGTGPHAEHFVGNYQQELKQGIISLVYLSGQPVCENAISENPNHNPTLDQQLSITTDAMIAVPVTALGEISGVLTCVLTRPAGSSEDPSRFHAKDLVEFEFAAACVGRILDAALLTIG